MQILPYDGMMRTTPKKAHEGQARAKFNFVAQTNLELSLAKGESVRVEFRKLDSRRKVEVTFFLFMFTILVRRRIGSSDEKGRRKLVRRPYRNQKGDLPDFLR